MTMADLFGVTPQIKREARFWRGHRLRVSRSWAPGPRAYIIGCNPSLGNGERDDPTISWLINWTRPRGFGGFDLGNLYPFVTADPTECRRIVEHDVPLQIELHEALHDMTPREVRLQARSAAQVFVCWGGIAWDQPWIERMVSAIQHGGGDGPAPNLWCWGTTASGAPKHPMARGVHRIARDQEPILWRAAP